MTTATGWLQDLAARHAGAPALVEPGGSTVTFAELEGRVAALAGGLRSLGLVRGDRVASYLPNGVLPVELLLAAGRLGAVTIGVNTRYRAADLRHLVEQGRPKVLVRADRFLDIDFAGIVDGALDRLPDRPDVVRAADLDALRSAAPVTDGDANAGDLLVAFTTSGTTGRPKLAAHDHTTSFRHARAVARAQGIGPESVALLGLPICGTFGFVTLFAALDGGATVVVPSRFEAGAAASLIEAHRVTHFNGSDDMLLGVIAEGGDLSSWQRGVHADFTGQGAESVRAAERVGARISGVYGSSETFALLFHRPSHLPTELRARNGGLPVDRAMEVRAVDGEIQLRGPSVLSAYLVADGSAPSPLTDDGWFCTGDLGIVDGDGGFTYLARLGDALRLSGFLTDPAEIEGHLVTHPAVTAAQVVGAPADGKGEVPVAFVTVDAPVDEGELVAHCRAGLANYKVPARVAIVRAFPTVEGANGVKVRKTDLRDRAVELLRGG